MDNNNAFYGGVRSSHKKIWLAGLIVFVVGIALAGWFIFGDSDLEESKSDTTETSQPSDTSPPLEVSLAGVTDGQTVSGEITIATDISNPADVQRAELYIDDVFFGVTYAAPFSFLFDTQSLTEGEHKVFIKVYSKSGQEASSKIITILVGPQSTAGQSGQNSSAGRRSAPTNAGGGNNNSGSGSAGDSASPTVPGNLVLSAEDGYTTSLSWNASSDNVAVSGYKVYRDGVLLADVPGTSYQDQTVVPGNTYEYYVTATDIAGNISNPSSEPSITLVPTSMWINGDAPQVVESSDGDSYELGVKFRPLVNGRLTGVKFYKAPNNTGTHIGNLWEGDGTHLASVTFTDETATGWQTATFSTPIDIVAGTTYVASYSVPNGRFSTSSQYFASEGITSQYLTALASGVDGNNGVFNETPGSFPSGSFQNTNYWIDVTFVPNLNAGGPTVKSLDNSKVYPGFPGSNNTGVPVGKRLPTRDRGIFVYQDNIVIENIEVGQGVTVTASNTTIRESKINGPVNIDINAPGGSGWSATIEDTEVAAGEVTVGAISSGNVTIVRSNIHGGQHNVHCSGGCTIEDSWLHGQYVYGVIPNESHNNAFISNGGSNMTITGSTVSCDSPANGTGGGCSGDVSLFGDFAPVTDVTLDGNLFTASVDTPYCLYGGYQADKTFGLDTENIVVTNNTFQRGSNSLCGAHGPVTNFVLDSTGLPAPGNVWTNNKWDDGSILPSP